MSHRDPVTAARPPWWRRLWPRRPQRVHLPDHLWPLVVRTARTQRMSPEQWVQHVTAAAASAHVLGQQPPRDGQGQHPQQWRQALTLLASAPDAHWLLVAAGHVTDVDGRFTDADPGQAMRERRTARPSRTRPRPVGGPAGQ